MPSVEQRPRGGGGITARVIWRQDGQPAAEKFAPNSRHSPFWRSLRRRCRGPSTTRSAATCRTSRPRTSGSGSHGGIRASRRRPTTTASCSASSPGPL